MADVENVSPNQLDTDKMDTSKPNVQKVEEPKSPPRRTSRRKRRRGGAKKPSAAMYVGYVEEGESVEMIMKKFAKLEELEKKKTEAAAKETESTSEVKSEKQQLTEKEYEELFKETSTFKLETAVKDQEMSYNENIDEDGWDMSGVQAHEDEDGEVTYFFGDGTDDDLWDELFGAKSKRKKRSGIRSGRRHATGVTQIAFVSDMNGRYVTGLKKVRYVDPDAIVYTKVPRAPLPLSWAKVVAPYAPAGRHTNTFWRPGQIICLKEQFTPEIPPNSETIDVPDLLNFNLVEHASKHVDGFQGIVLSPPWKERFPTQQTYNPSGIVPEDLLKLNLGSRKLLKSGFVYIWSPKHLIHKILKVFEKMDFFYVENAISVRQSVDNKIRGENCQVFRQSKETLLILRRGKKKKTGKLEWERVEIRHQRTSDVHFNHIRNNEAGVESEPHAYVHNMVETMLPHGRFNPLPREALPPPKGVDVSKLPPVPEVDPKEDTQQGRLVHLWAPKDRRRTGWLTVSCC